MATRRTQPGIAVPLHTAVRWLTLLVGQTTVLGALLFYFGWVRTQSLLLHFGLDNNLVRQSWSDYVLRSSNLVIRGLVIATLGLAALLVVIELAGPVLRRRERPRRVVRRTAYGLAGALGLLGVLGYYDLLVYSRAYPVVPGLTATAAACLLLALVLRPTAPHRTRDQRIALSSLVAALVSVIVFSAFWAVSTYATVVGDSFARTIESSPGLRPRVVVYADQDLGLDRPASALTTPNGRYTVRYTGLRLLIYSADRYVLLPDGWHSGADPAYLIEDTEHIRVEILVS